MLKGQDNNKKNIKYFKQYEIYSENYDIDNNRKSKNARLTRVGND